MHIPDLRPIIRWVRAAGIAAEVFGWAALMVADYFWTGVTLIYLGFLLLILDLWFDPELSKKIISKFAVSFALLVAATFFTRAVVLADAPLEVTAIPTNADYPPDTKIAGINFRPEFTELQVIINNPTGRNYTDLNVVIRPSEPVAFITQSTNVPNVTFEDKNGFSVRMMAATSSAAKAIPLSLLATDAGYRVRCPSLPAHSHITVEMALGDIKFGIDSDRIAKLPLVDQPNDKNFILRVKFDDFSTYWMGHQDGDVYITVRPKPQFVTIEGDYTAIWRNRSFSQKLQFQYAPIINNQ